ncbi:CHY zinc finger protein [Macrococcus animalis]|uniref:CHY zinc finger protein n=1 Tax=Macrococcus animalis TaxID=3395467 RepID=UPI0039BE5C44
MADYLIEGVAVDEQGRCEHYHSPVDVVCYQFPENDTYYPCHLCYEAIHQSAPQAKYSIHSDLKAVLCGVCQTEIAINAYVQSNQCPNCTHPFNPGCKNHFHLYFEIEY